MFFNIGSRLALYTGNTTYYNWANTTYNWMARIGLLNETTWAIFDGSDDRLNCTQLDHDQWTYNVGIYLFGAANMYNYTASLDPSDPAAADAALWKSRVTNLATSGLDWFFQDGIMFEPCEATNNCNADKKSFKAYLSRWMPATTKIAPFAYDLIKPKMVSAATAAAAQCDGGVNAIGTGAGRQCGLRWTMNSTYDGDTGVGQQMAALEIIQGNLIEQAGATFTNSTGGISVGDPNAGSANVGVGPNGLLPIVVTSADKVGAGFITFFTIVFIIGACWWMVSGEKLSDSPNQMMNKDRKKEWGWGDLSMGARIARRQFTQKGYTDRDSMALEKLKAGRAGSGMMDRDSAGFYSAGHHTSGSIADVFETGLPFASGNVSHPGSGGLIYSSAAGNGSGILPGSRPGSSRGPGFADGNGAFGNNGSRPGSSRGALYNGGMVQGHPVGQAS